jgi:endogenous inhibitor of DNA gyrase (YacG/DUF329 family)
MNPTTLTCPNCGKDFQPKRSNAIYCSDSCKQTTYNRRKESKLLTNDLSVNNVNPDVNEYVNEIPENESLIVKNVSDNPVTINKIDVNKNNTVNEIDGKQDTVNPYFYKRLPSAVKELNKHLISWIDEMPKYDEEGFCLQKTCDLIGRIKDALDNYEDDPAEYPHINFINAELLYFLHDILNAMAEDPDTEGVLGCGSDHIDALRKMKYSLV